MQSTVWQVAFFNELDLHPVLSIAPKILMQSAVWQAAFFTKMRSAECGIVAALKTEIRSIRFAQSV